MYVKMGIRVAIGKIMTHNIVTVQVHICDNNYIQSLRVLGSLMCNAIFSCAACTVTSQCQVKMHTRVDISFATSKQSKYLLNSGDCKDIDADET